MFSARTATHANPAGTIVTRHLEGSVVESVCTGQVSLPLLQSVLGDTPMILAEVPRLRWLVDLTAVTGFDAAVRHAGTGILELFRARGGQLVVFVLPSGLLRMMVATIALAVGVHAKLFETRAEALAYVRSG